MLRLGRRGGCNVMCGGGGGGESTEDVCYSDVWMDYYGLDDIALG